MNKYILVFISFFAITVSSAQSMKEEVQIFQNVFGLEKKAVVSQFIKFDDNLKKDIFWELYDDYETERKALGEKRIALLADYASNYYSLTDEKIESLLKQSVKVNNGLDNLILKHYKRMKKPLGIKTAAQFAQVEKYFQAAIQFEISTRFPFIDELK